MIVTELCHAHYRWAEAQLPWTALDDDGEERQLEEVSYLSGLIAQVSNPCSQHETTFDFDAYEAELEGAESDSE